MDADDDDNRHQLGPHAHDDEDDDEDADPNLPHHDEEGNEEDEEEEDDSLSDDEDENEEDRDDLLHQSHGSPNPDDDEEEEEADDDDDNEISTPDTNTAAPLVVLNHSHHHRHPGNDGRNGADDVAAVGLVTPAAAAATMTPSRSAAVKRSVADASPGGGGARAGTTTTTTTGSKRLKVTDDEDAGTPEEQAEFLNEVETFYRERSLEFKAPKFYGEPLNCLKLWNAVVRLGGYDRVTACKLWRQVGESFHPPKTCTTVSWTFRIFYEKALLEYEKHKRQIGELEFPGLPLTEPTAVENEGSGSQNTGSGRARRDAAARAMQGWHAQRLIGFGEVGEPIIKDKSLGASQKREKQLKSIGVNKLKKPSNLELAENDLHTESTKQLLTTVVDVGPPADWVKVSLRESKDCFEVYALVPGLLREEVRVQSDPAGRIVITGQPEQLENPWGITPFKKIVNLPARINPLQTSAVVSLHGRLFVRVPFERSSS